MKDSSPAILERWHEGLETLSPEERVKTACSMFSFARDLVRESIKNNNPPISEKDLARQVFIRFYQSDLNEEVLERIFDSFG